MKAPKKGELLSENHIEFYQDYFFNQSNEYLYSFYKSLTDITKKINSGELNKSLIKNEIKRIIKRNNLEILNKPIEIQSLLKDLNSKKKLTKKEALIKKSFSDFDFESERYSKNDIKNHHIKIKLIQEEMNQRELLEEIKTVLLENSKKQDEILNNQKEILFEMKNKSKKIES